MNYYTQDWYEDMPTAIREAYEEYMEGTNNEI